MHRVRRLWAAVLAVPVLVLSGTVASPALADTWSPPPGAVDLLFWGSTATSSIQSVTPVSADPAPTRDGALTTVAGLSIGRIPDIGTYTLSSRPTAGQVFADPTGTCGSGYTSVTGTIVVHELRYADDGTLQQIAAEVTRTCGYASSLVWRWHSAVPYPRLSVTPPAASTSEVGDTWSGEWTVHNTGTNSLTLSGFATPPTGQSLGGTCTKGLVLPVDGTCTVTLTYDTLTAHATRVALGVGVGADNVPGVSALSTLNLPDALVPPTLWVAGRTSTDVGLAWSPGQSPQDDPVAGYELMRTSNGVTTAVPLTSGAARSWHGPAQRAGSFGFAWSVRLVTSSGRRSVLTPWVAADNFTSAMLGASGGALVGGASSGDASVVRLLDAGDLPTATTVAGVDASPDRTHLLLTLHDGNGGADALWLTDLRGQNHQVVDTSAVPAGAFRRAVLSPDGRRAAVSTTADGIAVLDLGASPARTTVLAPTGQVQAWSPDGTRLLVLGGTVAGGQPAPAGLRWVTIASGVATALPGSAAATAADVDRLGDVVWREAGASAGTDKLQVLAAGATVPKTLWSPVGCALGVPAYSPGAGSLAVGVSGAGCSALAGGVARTMVVPLNGATFAGTPNVALPVELEGPVAHTRLVTLAPVPTLMLEARDANPNDGQTPVTRGSVAIVPTVSDADDPVQALTATCSTDGAAAQPCSVAGFTSPVLGQGTHTLTMTVADPAGHTTPPATVMWTVDTTAPTAWMTGIPPVYAQSVGWDWVSLPGQVSWAGHDAGGAGGLTFDTRYRYASPTGSWSRQLALNTGTETWTSFGFQQGYSYCLTVRATDAAGNVGPWSAERCTSAVLDDNFVSDGVSRALPLHYRAYAYGDISPMYNGESRQSQTVTARRIGVVMTTCPTCGSFEVWQGKVRLGVVSGYSASKTYRTVRWLPASSTYRWGQVVLKAVSKGRVAFFDGLVIGK
ncbi:MAG: TolB family protein [Oryzihumus sp.]